MSALATTLLFAVGWCILFTMTHGVISQLWPGALTVGAKALFSLALCPAVFVLLGDKAIWGPVSRPAQGAWGGCACHRHSLRGHSHAGLPAHAKRGPLPHALWTLGSTREKAAVLPADRRLVAAMWSGQSLRLTLTGLRTRRPLDAQLVSARAASQ
jgi:hypothetical protein